MMKKTRVYYRNRNLFIKSFLFGVISAFLFLMFMSAAKAEIISFDPLPEKHIFCGALVSMHKACEIESRCCAFVADESIKEEDFGLDPLNTFCSVDIVDGHVFEGCVVQLYFDESEILLKD